MSFGAALAIVVRLAVYAAAIAVVLDLVVGWSAGVGLEPAFRENGPIEWLQAALVAGAGMWLLRLGAARADLATLLSLLGLVALFAGVRELDGVLDQLVAKGAYKLPAAVVLAAAAVVAWRGRRALGGELASFLTRPAAYLVFFGAFLVLVPAQILGQKELWYALPEPSAQRTAKKVFEESTELVGYLVLAAAAVETWINDRCRSRP